MATTDDLFEQAVTAHQTGDLDAAERGYRQLLSIASDHSASLTNLASIVARRGDAQEAEQLYIQAVSAAPDHADAHFNLGNLYRRLGRLREAASEYEEVLRIAPDAPAALVNLGLASGDLGEWPRAIDCFARAATVAPHLPDVLDLLADSLARVGRREESVLALREATSRFPNSPRSHLNLGVHLAATGAVEEAIPAFEQALALKPDYPEAHNALGVALETISRTDDAQHAYQEAIRYRPDFVDAWANLGTSLGEQGRCGEAIPALRRSLSVRPNPIVGSTLLCNVLYSADFTPEQVRDEHIAWAEAHANKLAPADPPRKRPHSTQGRIRVGYVAGEFRSRAASAFLEALLTHHDRQQIHVTVYACPIRADNSPDSLRKLADSWKPAGHLTDEKLAEMIRTDEIDILVDLNGHTAGNRLLTFARKPAATQISLFGYHCTTGLQALDFRITDATADPLGHTDALYTEKLLRLPDISWFYVPPPSAPTPNALPASRRQVFTFGCLNHPGKLSEPCVEAWSAILKAVPKSRLVLLAGRSVVAADVLAARFTSRGISSDRIELMYRLPAGDYMEAYQPLDLALDPFPHGGALTTCDALWMGVPVLTATGRDTRARQGTSILNVLGLPEFVADTPEQLVGLAATWADQREPLADLRATLRDLMSDSPVTAAANYVKHLEAAYRSV